MRHCKNNIDPRMPITTDPTYTASTILGYWPLNQRATHRWIAGRDARDRPSELANSQEVVSDELKLEIVEPPPSSR